ncbi:MAG: PilC/PilY family type IV pilus protein [Syntrophobacterales bacterium]|jgi:type IV pilus assembly protein PilY1
MKHLKRYGISLLILALGLWTTGKAEAANSVGPYVSSPIFMTNAVPPNVLIIFDNSGSMNSMAYWQEATAHDDETPGEFDIVPTTPYDPNRNYYGYFVAGTPGNRVWYSYASNKFSRDPNGAWEGNFLNWLCMRRVDVARKVLVGGLATSRTGGGNTTLIAEDPAQWGRSYKCKLDWSLLVQYTPFGGDLQDRYLGLKDGYLYVSQDLINSPFTIFDFKYDVKVQRDSSYPDEAWDFKDGNIAGVMQKVGDKAYWGLEFFRSGTGNGENGGYIKNRVGHPTITNLYTNIENEAMQNWTPLAESYYVAMQYFKQQPIDAALTSEYNPGYQINSTWDPYIQDGDSSHCAKTFVLLFTDGSSTMDMMIPDAYKAYDGDASDPDGDPADPNIPPPAYVSSGTDYLDDIALYGKVNDLRPDLEGDQNIELFVVYAFGDDPAARRLLKDSARNGGFIEKNGNNRPDPATGTAVDVVDYTTPVVDDSWSEWWEDKRISLDGRALPDTYFEAKDGWRLEQELINAITKILERANSGTAVSVLATSGEGEGALYQAYFRPKSSTATEEVHWTGHLQGLWIDAFGNLREDVGVKGKLELGTDPIVTFFYEETSGETLFQRRQVKATDIYGTQSTPTTHLLPELSPLWEAGSLLAGRSAANRNIYTFVDLDKDREVDGKHSVDSGEFINFNAANQSDLQIYLDLAEDTTTPEIEFAYLGVDEPTRAFNLINYIRGDDSAPVNTDLRNRTLGADVYKLGDIVHSTPTPVGRPVDNYDLIYKDETYKEFYQLHMNRETVVYTGANDGMLHAFLAGVFKSGDKFTGDNAEFVVDNIKYPGLTAGDEIWAYIPQNLLPHLKWLADPTYMDGTHVYYVDLKPRIFDARIYEGASNAGHPLNAVWTTGMTNAQRVARPYGWCTVLVGGMRFGGGSIPVKGDWDGNSTTLDTTKTFASSYFAIDVTDPKNPILLWERNQTDYPGLGFTTSFPAVLKVEKRNIIPGSPDIVDVLERHWYLLFGSGPTTYDGNSTQRSSIYLVDMATGRTDLTGYNKGRIFTHLTDDNGINDVLLNDQGFMGSPVSVDLSLDYSVNVSYIGETHASGPNTYGGGLYRLQVPTTVGTANGEPVLLYEVDPDKWVLSHMFDADRAVTASPAAAVGTVDSGYSLWLYFGTGRYMSAEDKTDTTTEHFLFGVKDPYYNSLLDTADMNTLLNSEPFTKDDLFPTTDVKVYTDGTITGTGVPATFDELKVMQDFGSTYEVGWYKMLVNGERILNKPSLLGGILLAPSFVPNEDVCAFGGSSYLHALYFETGTAYSKSVVGVEAEGSKDKVLDKIDLGLGISSSLGIHVGREHGARGFIQQSTGTITQIDMQPAFNVKSGFVNWREVR